MAKYTWEYDTDNYNDLREDLTRNEVRALLSADIPVFFTLLGDMPAAVDELDAGQEVIRTTDGKTWRVERTS